ncbi:MAG: MgtC/SapB family protein, partial [Hyphomicrobiales bacterium]|nr:MgtC/SapB family protein [Hyphomicrobiales bacterium]
AIGFDRDIEGHSAGLRTTILVGLAACLAMVQANWLMNAVGKSSGSFVELDLMRLPLGILTGVGFIGGGAILKRGDNVHGLTTAATLWFVTVVGLCFGGGQIGLGAAGGVLGLLILRALKLPELKFKQKRASQLRLKWKAGEGDAAQAMSTPPPRRSGNSQFFRQARRNHPGRRALVFGSPLRAVWGPRPSSGRGRGRRPARRSRVAMDGLAPVARNAGERRSRALWQKIARVGRREVGPPPRNS